MTDPDTTNIDIELDLEGDVDDHLAQLADEFALTRSQTEDVREELELLIDEQAPDADSETRNVMMKTLLTTLRQTLDQLDEPPESYL